MEKIMYKPCPFCGAEDENICATRNGSKNGVFYYVECQICGGRTRGICRPWYMIKDPKDETDEDRWNNDQVNQVRKLWNTRSGGNA